jgi:hypothetical protein
MARGKRSQVEDVDEWTPDSDEAGYGSRSRKARKGPSADSRVAVPKEIVVSTKFPVARIKRIMQADEEVGKVAQVTPIVVCEYHGTHRDSSR